MTNLCQRSDCNSHVQNETSQLFRKRDLSLSQLSDELEFLIQSAILHESGAEKQLSYCCYRCGLVYASIDILRNLRYTTASDSPCPMLSRKTPGQHLEKLDHKHATERIAGNARSSTYRHDNLLRASPLSTCKSTVIPSASNTAALLTKQKQWRRFHLESEELEDFEIKQRRTRSERRRQTSSKYRLTAVCSTRKIKFFTNAAAEDTKKRRQPSKRYGILFQTVDLSPLRTELEGSLMVPATDTMTLDDKFGFSAE